MKTTIKLRFLSSERTLIQELLLDQSCVAKALETAKRRNGRFKVECSLDDLEELLNSIAAEANHTESKTKQKRFDSLFDRLERIQDEHEAA